MEDVFNIRYNTKLDKLEIIKEKKGKKIFKLLQKHKVLFVVCVSFIGLCTINFYLIFSFMKILENI